MYSKQPGRPTIWEMIQRVPIVAEAFDKLLQDERDIDQALLEAGIDGNNPIQLDAWSRRVLGMTGAELYALQLSDAATYVALAVNAEAKRDERMATAIAEKSKRSFGQVLRAYRLMNGLTQEKLAAAARTSKQSIVNYEKDRAVPGPEAVPFLVEALGIPASELVGVL